MKNQKAICIVCKKEFYYYISSGRTGKFCSLKCSNSGIHNPMFGKVHPNKDKRGLWKWNEQSKKKLVIWNKGKKLSEETKRKISKNTSIAVKKQFENGRKLSEKTLETLKEGRKKSNKFTSENNPMKNPIIKEKMRRSLIKLYQEHPEKHINRILARNNRLSKPQMLLYNYLLIYYPNAQLNYRLKTKNGNRFLDIGIPSLKLCYEYDSDYWHQDKEKDRLRDLEINSEGWSVIHINQKDLGVILSNNKTVYR